MRRNYISVLFMLMMATMASGQMEIDGQILYGNEWVNYDDDHHLEIKVAEEGIYKVTRADLESNGIPVGLIIGNDIQVLNNGKQMPLYMSNEGAWGADDYLLFYGKGNDGELDQHLYVDAETEQLNPRVSMYDDERSYFLRIREGATFTARYDLHNNDLTGQLPQVETFFMDVSEVVYQDLAANPEVPNDPQIHYSHFIATDGFGTRFSQNNTAEVPLKNIFTGGPDPTLRLRTGSIRGGAEHRIEISINDDEKLIDDVYSGAQVKEYEQEFDFDFLRDNINYVKVSGLETSDKVSIAFAEITYPRQHDANSQGYYTFYTPDNNLRTYYEIPMFNAVGDVFAFDIDNEVVVTPELGPGVAKFTLPNRQETHSKVILVNEESLAEPVSIERVEFQDFRQLDPQFLILTSERLNVEENGRNAVQDYADFRSSDMGGNYKTGIINFEDLADQFAYGIDNHTIAIRNFSQYIKQEWSDFQMVLILGKGLSFANKNRNTIQENFVPTYGRPGSDNFLFAAPGNTYPDVGVGRIAAQSQEDVLIGLDKAISHVMLSDVINLPIEDRMWLKNVLHLSGGDVTILEQIFRALETMRMTIENNQFGANTHTIRKNSSDPVTTALTQDILDRINEGVSLLTFFGHSSAGTFDFSIESPDKYDNEGKYPVVVSLGCHSGDIHETVYSLSEDFVLTEKKGAVAFIASSGNAYIEELKTMGDGFYDEVGTDYYGQPIGLALKDVYNQIHDFWFENWSNGPQNTPFMLSRPSVITLQQQTTLHGDPAVTFFNADGPDYVVDLKTVETMDVIGTTDEKIDLQFDIVNLGAGITNDSLNNMLIHGYGGGQLDTFYFKSAATLNRTSVAISIDNPGTDAIGKNSINIILDYDEKVEEQPQPVAEDNNDLKVGWNTTDGFCFFIFDNSARPVFPPDFGIVYDQDLTLVSSSNNALAPEATYLIELDTTELFDSPGLLTQEVVSAPSYIAWKPGITMEEEKVYYWRVKPKDDPQAIWNTASFVYLEDGAPGWNQSHFYQWTKDEYINSERDSLSRDQVYIDNISEIKFSNLKYINDGQLPNVVYQNTPTAYIPFFGEVEAGVYMATFNGKTGVARVNDHLQNGEFGSHIDATWAEGFICYPYWTNTEEWRGRVINFIENVVPDGDYIALMTIQREGQTYKPEEWAADAANGDDLMTILEKYGAKNVRDLAQNAVPYIFIFKKNDTGFVPIEIMASNELESITADFQIQGRWFEGEMRSTTIGPAVSWDKLIWDISEIEVNDDTYTLNVYGKHVNGGDSLLFADVKDAEFDLSSIDASLYPELELQWYTADENSRTAAQLGHWRVLYAGMPEAVLDLASKYEFNKDTMALGDIFKFESTARNVSSYDMDSLLVQYVITDQDNEQHIKEERMAPLASMDTLPLSFEFPTNDLIGLNEFKVEINYGREQTERYYFNNVGLRDFKVEGDMTNPLLDVTFDGVRIIDGDIISPTPVIVATLKDENTNLPVTDISSFDLALQKLPDTQSYPIDLNGSDVQFFPADSSNNYCARIEYYPELEGGEYILFVQAQDASGNLSGDMAYQVRFLISSESEVTNVLNYPNPFSTSTEFVFTLTGTEIPEVFTIQIFTMSGKMVKEITKEELGTIRLGQNRTDYKWNGTDDFGSRLANGVYLYRVITSDSDGNSIDKVRNDHLDSFFNKGFGKLVIMR